MGKLDRPGLRTAEAATIQQANQDTVLKQLGCFQQAPHFFPGKYYWKFFVMLNGGQLDPLVVQLCQPESKADPVNGKLEVGIRRGVVSLLAEVEIIVDLVDVQLGG